MRLSCKIRGRFIKAIPHVVRTLTLVTFFVGCLKDDSVHFSSNIPEYPFVKLRLERADGTDLLNPQTPHGITMDSIAISYVGELDPSNAAEVCRIYMEDSIHYCLKVYVCLRTFVSQSFTYVTFGKNSRRDLIKAQLSWFGGVYFLDGYSVNDDYADGGRTFVLVK